jgi:hypothetical protein
VISEAPSGAACKPGWGLTEKSVKQDEQDKLPIQKQRPNGIASSLMPIRFSILSILFILLKFPVLTPPPRLRFVCLV